MDRVQALQEDGQDDASRFITGYGIFGEAMTRHAIDVLHEAIRNHGRPGQVMTDHGSQFYSNESSVRAPRYMLRASGGPHRHFVGPKGGVHIGIGKRKIK